MKAKSWEQIEVLDFWQEGRSQSSSWAVYAWMAASITSIHPQQCILGKHEKLAETKLLHIYDIIRGMFTSVVVSLKFSWF